jgi:type IV pilus assembly protein PilY1
MFRKVIVILLSAATMAVPMLASGDDTDIYIDNTRPVRDESLPMVMFSVDYRANLGSTICSDVTAASCTAATYLRAALGPAIAATAMPASGPLTFFDLIRLSLRVVLRESKGFKAGLMFNHNNTAVTRVTPPVIVNTDACNATGGAKLAIGDAYSVEGDTATKNELLDFTITLSAACNNRVDVDYTITFTGDDPADAGDLAAGTPLTGTISFDNLGSKTNTSTHLYVPIIGDAADEANEDLTVTLSNPRVSSGSGSVSLLAGHEMGIGSIDTDDPDTGGCDGPQGPGVICSNGGYIARRFKVIRNSVANNLPDNDESRRELLDVLDALPPTGGNISQPYQGKELFFEFFRYLTGQRVHNGGNGWLDYGTDNTQNLGLRDANADGTYSGTFTGSGDNIAVGRDTRSATGGVTGERTYNSPLLSADSCAKIFTVNFLFGVSNQENESDTAINANAIVTGGRGGFGLPAAAQIPGDNTGFPKTIGFLYDADLSSNTYGTVVGSIPGKQNVTSFFIARPTPENSEPPAYDATTVSYAREGGSKFPLPLASDPAKLIAAIRSVLDQILSVSTTFVAASVPVNVFNRAEIVNNVYFAVFQAEAGARWPGNLKKLKIGTADLDGDGDVETAIVDGQSPPVPAIETSGDDQGRIKQTARSAWTLFGTTNSGYLQVGDTNGDGVVDNFFPPGSNTPADVEGVVPLKDGRYITRGGAGQKMPGFLSGNSPGKANPTTNGGLDPAPAAGPRKVLYLKSSTGATATTTTLDALDNTLTTDEAALVKLQLGNSLMSNTDLNLLVNFTRGLDVEDGDGDGSDTDARSWMMGDSLHSRPLPINYGGTEANPTIFIALASNDGHLRFIRNTTSSGGELGQEVWSFVPPEGLAVQQQLLRESSTAIPTHPYSLDGEPSALIIDQDSDGQVEAGDRVLLFFGLGRGGKAFYALDVTNPDHPVFLWRIAPGSRTTATGRTLGQEYDEMGFSTSRPRIGSVSATNADGTVSRRLAVFFGGGYYGGHIQSGGQNTPDRIGNDVDGEMADDANGNSIFIVKASDGSLIWKAVGPTSAASGSRVFKHAELRDSIASNLTILDTDNDGIHDRIYVGDQGGNVWRADLGPDTDATANGTEDDWALSRLACVGRHSGASAAGGCIAGSGARGDDRRFFHEPDVIQARDASGRFDAVLIGSGDRSDPLDQGGDVENFFYMIRDTATGVGGTPVTDLNHIDLTRINDICVTGAVGACEISAKGWKLELTKPNGEKALSAPVTIANTVFFTTYLPPPPGFPPSGECGPQEGGGFLYAISLFDGSPAKDYDEDGTPKEANDRSLDLGTPGIPAQVVFLGSPSAFSGATEGGAAASCTLNILAGGQVFEAPGCPRFRTYWQRVGS